MAHQDEDGFFYIDGRYKDMIKSGGENIYAAEVETAFREHPAIKDCALIGVPDEKWGEVGMLILVPNEAQEPDPDELKRFGGERLARYKIPKSFVVADVLPYSAYGKVEKVKLKEQYLD
jgi:fatty-acyl-CoA synthase